jgi:hypothetical protein
MLNLAVDPAVSEALCVAIVHQEILKNTVVALTPAVDEELPPTARQVPDGAPAFPPDVMVLAYVPEFIKLDACSEDPA